jgi:hypothetical protein
MLWRTGCFMCLLHPSFNRWIGLNLPWSIGPYQASI